MKVRDLGRALPAANPRLPAPGRRANGALQIGRLRRVTLRDTPGYQGGIWRLLRR